MRQNLDKYDKKQMKIKIIENNQNTMATKFKFDIL